MVAWNDKKANFGHGSEVDWEWKNFSPSLAPAPAPDKMTCPALGWMQLEVPLGPSQFTG